ncbi:MAG: ABC transporter ATP-binding protein [Enterococcus sp.]
MTLELKNIELTIQQREILKGVHLTINDGEFVSLVAPSGAGKSTILKVLTGLQAPSNGEVWLNQQKIVGLNQHFSYMPQDDLLLPWLSVYQNVTLFQKINHLPINQEQVLAQLELFGLVDVRNFLPHQLSGGMKQRVALLRTMMNPAQHVLLDEPFGALDAMTRAKMQDWLLTVIQKVKKTTILVTHDIEEAIYLSHRLVVLTKRPAQVKKEFTIAPNKRTRQWLITQAALKQEIQQLLVGEDDVN